MKADLVVVGAGFSGAVIAERAATQLGWRVLVIEQRDHIGGNAYDCLDDHGILVHRYGPHIFHTNSERVWTYLSRFTAWRPYEHRVQAVIGTASVPLPFNLNSLGCLFPATRARAARDALVQAYGFGASVPILRLRQSRHRTLRGLADYVYENIFLHYTVKQWGMRPEELDPSVTARVPIRISHDNRFFTDRFQGMPRDGYTALFNRMLAHPNIRVLLNTDFHELNGALRYRRLVYTGPIDRFFDYRHGELPYRSLRFDFRHLPQDRVQPSGTVNYPNDHEYTRSYEFKLLTGQRSSGTTIAYEFPQPHCPPHTTPYYPIPRRDNRERYRAYATDAAGRDDLIFCGRLASYKYLNMDQAVGRALRTFEHAVAPTARACQPAV